MAKPDIATLLADRAQQAQLSLSPSLSDGLAAYYRILAHWNRTINLTSLKDPVEAIDRLLLEPVAAAQQLGPDACGSALIDLGSGGGSPGIPLSLALETKRLVMVESRARKAAFLRAATRELDLNASVECARFEELVERAEFAAAFDLLSVRAVRIDDPLIAVAPRPLRAGGRLLLLGAVPAQVDADRHGLVLRQPIRLFNGKTLTVAVRR